MSKPPVAWLTGLPGSGKTTLANALAVRLGASGRTPVIFDGDAVRQLLTKGLGFGKADRIENSRKVALAAVNASVNGEQPIVALISPYLEAHRVARRICWEAGVRMIEVVRS